MRIVYFVHATTEDNERGLATGWNDVPLSAKGRCQAEELRDAVAGRFDVVICSDLERALETARIAFAPIVPVADRRLHEIDYGTLAGCPAAEVKKDLTRYTDKPFPGGESYEDVRARVAAFLDEIRGKYIDRRVALVAHQAPQLAIDVILYGKTWTEAFRDDWRNTKAWQPGWSHEV